MDEKPTNKIARNKNRVPINERAGLRADPSAQYIGVSTAQFYRLKDEPDFPEGVRLTPGVVVWLRCELDDWLRRRATRPPAADAGKQQALIQPCRTLQARSRWDPLRDVRDDLDPQKSASSELPEQAR